MKTPRSQPDLSRSPMLCECFTDYSHGDGFVFCVLRSGNSGLFSFVSTDINAVNRTRTYVRESINTNYFQFSRNQNSGRKPYKGTVSCFMFHTKRSSASAPLNDFPESSYGGTGYHKNWPHYLHETPSEGCMFRTLLTTTSTIPLAQSIKPRA